MKILEKTSAFSLQVSFTLSQTDEEVLDLLYLPLVQADGLSSYHLLHSLGLSQKSGYLHHEDILPILGLDSTGFLMARNKLEAIGLLETFRKEEKGKSGECAVFYLYRLIPPATPKKFFNDPILRLSLSSKVGDKRYFELKSLFQAEEKEAPGFVEVTSDFKSVFTLAMEKGDPALLDNGLNSLEKRYKSQAKFKEDVFRKCLAEKGVLVPASLPEDVFRFPVLYGIKEEDAASLYEKNLTTDNVFSAEGYKKDCRNFQHFAPASKMMAPLSSDYGDNKTAAYRKAFDTLTPQEYLNIRYGVKPAPYMLGEVEKLQDDFGFPNSVINVLLDYSLKKTAGEFNNLYIEKVAFTLSSLKIKDSYSAMEALNSRDFDKNQAKKQSIRKNSLPGKKKEELPESNEEKEEDTESETKVEDLISLEKKLGI
ncbi:MAG: DnaD domain protein [Bacilli bacterium]